MDENGKTSMSVIVVTGTGTGIGKTVVTAALAAAALAGGRSVAVLKPAQTGVAPGEDGDAAVAARLAGAVTSRELARYPEPLAPATAARRAGAAPVTPARVAQAAAELAACHDLVLVEGAGGLLVHLDDSGATLADAAALLGAPVLAVAPAGLGTLNATALTAEALRTRGVPLLGCVIGSWPQAPDLAARCNLADLPSAAGAPLLGAVPEGAGALEPTAFRAAAAGWLAPQLGGTWEGADFAAAFGPPPAADAPGPQEPVAGDGPAGVDALVLDCGEPAGLARFWGALLGAEAVDRGPDWSCVDPPRGPRVAFQRVPEGKRVKNRLHMDLGTEDVEAAAEAAVRRGARRLGAVVEDAQGRFQVLADPEGNEFCFVSPAPAPGEG